MTEVFDLLLRGSDCVLPDGVHKADVREQTAREADGSFLPGDPTQLPLHFQVRTADALCHP